MATETLVNGSTMPDDGDLMTPAEVAQAFRVERGTVTRWAKNGKITSIRTPGGHRRYSGPEVRALLNGTVQERSR